jgi:DNA replication protein DnaC
MTSHLAKTIKQPLSNHTQQSFSDIDWEDDDTPSPADKRPTGLELVAEAMRQREAAEAAKCKLTPEEFFGLSEEEQAKLTSPECHWKEFRRLWEPSDWTRQLSNDVMLGKPCPVCEATKQCPAILKGERTGTYGKGTLRCYCADLPMKLRFLSNPWGIPKKYLFADLETLQPIPTSPLSTARQAEEIEFLRQHPNDSYFFCGQPGTSKTTYCSALIRHAYDPWWDFLIDRVSGAPIRPSWIWIWRINFDVLMGQIQRYEYRTFGSQEEVPPPDLTPSRITKAASEMSATSGRPLLCLEEVDKTRMTVDRLNRLEALVDAIYNCEGQLLLTTNLTYAAFAAMVIETKPETGEPLMRRIEEMCHVREYFEQEQS